MRSSALVESEIRLLISRGNHFAAWAKMRDAILEEPSLPLCHSLAKLADGLDRNQAELRTMRIALLGSFTLEPLAPVLKACALGSRVLPEIYVGGFNAWRQEILDEESGLRRFQPEVTILALRVEELAPELAYRFTHLEPAEVRAQIDGTVCDCEKFLRALREWSSSKILAHSLPSPVFPDLGILDYQCSEGQHSAFRDLNDAWNAAVRGVGDAWVVDCGRLIQEVGWNRWHDPRMWASARMPLSGSAVRRLAEEYVKYLSAFLGSSKKVLVVDLDNTLWGGILGEDGFDGIQLGPEYPGSAYVEVQRAILTLQARGVVLAINSKNNPSDAWEVIEKHPGMILRPDHFAAARINWNDKAGNLEELAEELNVGLEAFVYIDDSAAECERIRQSHPEVFTLHLASEPEKRAEKIRRLGMFDTLSFGTEDRSRTRMYRADTERKQLKSRAPSLEEYYVSLAMELTIRPLDQAAVARAAQLTQRTNQFNLTTRRYMESEIAALTASDHSEVYTAHLTDRFGEDGIVGLAIVKRQEDALRMDTFLMSCRVLGRGVETAFLTFVLRRAEQLGMREVMGEYRPTKKNGIAKDFLGKNGFHFEAHLQEGPLWRLGCVDFRRPYPYWLRVHTEGDSPNGANAPDHESDKTEADARG